MDFGIDVFRRTDSGVAYADGDVAIVADLRDISRVGAVRGNVYSIVACGAGSATFTVGGTDYVVSQGDMLFCPPGAIVEMTGGSDGFGGNALCITNRLVMGLLGGTIGVWNHALYVEKRLLYHLGPDHIRYLMSYAGIIEQKIVEDGVPYKREIVQSLLRAVLFEMCRMMDGTGTGDGGGTACQAKVLFGRFIDMLAAERVKKRPVYHYASSLCITPKYLTVVCKEVSGKTASDWIDEYLDEDLRFYLCMTAMPIKEVAEMLGFANVSFFGKYVKQHFGVTPAALRNGK